MKLPVFILAILLAGTFVNAQTINAPDQAPPKKGDHGFTFLLGPSVAYYKGPASTDIFPLQEERVNWQANGQFGFVFNKDREGRGNMLGVFGAAGLMRRYSMNQMFIDQDLNPAVFNNDKSSIFYQLEAGMYIGGILRLSSGIGRQQYYLADDEKRTAQYLSSTAGLNFSLGFIKWVVDFNWIYGKDFNNLVLRPSTGIMVKF